MKNFLQNYIQESEQTDISNIDKWEMCKIKIRNFSIEYGKKKKIQQKNELLSLYVKLKDLDLIIANDDDRRSVRETLLLLEVFFFPLFFHQVPNLNFSNIFQSYTLNILNPFNIL